MTSTFFSLYYFVFQYIKELVSVFSSDLRQILRAQRYELFCSCKLFFWFFFRGQIQLMNVTWLSSWNSKILLIMMVCWNENNFFPERYSHFNKQNSLITKKKVTFISWICILKSAFFWKKWKKIFLWQKSVLYLQRFYRK